MRGLKHFSLDRKHHGHESHLLQMRGLKLRLGLVQLISMVASFTDAWIETGRCLCKDSRRNVASFTDAWIETLRYAIGLKEEAVASFTDAWIETYI